MRYVARFVWSGVAQAGALDVGELMRWAFKRTMIVFGAVLVLVGAIVTPLPVPIGIPMMAIGGVVLLNSSDTVKRAFFRRYRKNPQTMRRIGAILRRRRPRRTPDA